MSLDTNNDRLTAKELARRIMGDCVNDPAFRAAVKSKSMSNKELAELFPGKAIGQYYPLLETDEKTKSYKTKVVSKALNTVRKKLEAEDNRNNFVAVGRPLQGPTSSSDGSTSGLTEIFAQVTLDNGKQGDDVSMMTGGTLMDYSLTDGKSNHHRHEVEDMSLNTEFKMTKNGRPTNSLGTIDEVVECTRDSLRVWCENWSLISSSHLSEEIKDGIRDWMLNDMMSNQELSPELLEHVKQLVGGGVF
jgi:hypothetical protein